jgi:uncharacterized protein (TIGR03905 family)
MKKKLTYQTKGTCSKSIDITVDDGVVTEVVFHGGCSGNTQGISALVKGMKVEDAIERMKGIKCGFKPTSCPDQLAIALTELGR